MNAPISLIIPAHNEATVIGRMLDTLKDGLASGELHACVVCNGCNDQTARIARRYPVQVIETPIGNKAAALNLGDRAAALFPRVYIDGDVIVSPATVRALAERLDKGDVLAVAPTGIFDTSGCSLLVRAYLHIASILPSSKEGVGGSGVYALSARGRQRFGMFPNVISDDGFVRIQFNKEERATLKDHTATVFPPRTLRDLIRTRVRVHVGHVELKQRYPRLWQDNGSSGNIGAIGVLFKQVRLWPPLVIYCAVAIAARFAAKCRTQHGWMRDETSRHWPHVSRFSQARTPR